MTYMKRILAALIDAGVVEVLTILFYSVAITVWRAVRNHHMAYMGSYSYRMVLGLYPMVFLVVGFLYFYLFSAFGSRRTLGKRIFRMPGEEERYKGKGHLCVVTACKLLACMLYPLTILWFCFFGKMPYDKIGGVADR